MHDHEFAGLPNLIRCSGRFLAVRSQDMRDVRDSAFVDNGLFALRNLMRLKYGASAGEYRADLRCCRVKARAQRDERTSAS
jgi:hypothetical protein